MLRNRHAALSIAASLVATTASAVTVTNLDDETRTVTVVEGETKQDHVVKPGAVLDGICREGCLIRLGPGDNDLYSLEGPEVTTIENGQLWGEDRNEPAVAPESEAGSSTSPSPRP